MASRSSGRVGQASRIASCNARAAWRVSSASTISLITEMPSAPGDDLVGVPGGDSAAREQGDAHSGFDAANDGRAERRGAACIVTEEHGLDDQKIGPSLLGGHRFSHGVDGLANQQAAAGLFGGRNGQALGRDVHTVGGRRDCDVNPVVDDQQHAAEREMSQAFGFAQQVARRHVGFAQLDHVHATRDLPRNLSRFIPKQDNQK